MNLKEIQNLKTINWEKADSNQNLKKKGNHKFLQEKMAKKPVN